MLVLKVTDGLGVWIVRRDEVSVKLGVSACLETDRLSIELVELPENIEDKMRVWKYTALHVSNLPAQLVDPLD